MKKIILLFAIILCASLAAEAQSTTCIVVGPRTTAFLDGNGALVVPSEGFTVTATCNYTVTDNSSWLTAYGSGGGLSISASENNTGSQRNGIVYLKDPSGLYVDILVYQDPLICEPSTAPTSITVE